MSGRGEPPRPCKRPQHRGEPGGASPLRKRALQFEQKKLQGSSPRARPSQWQPRPRSPRRGPGRMPGGREQAYCLLRPPLASCACCMLHTDSEPTPPQDGRFQFGLNLTSARLSGSGCPLHAPAAEGRNPGPVSKARVPAEPHFGDVRLIRRLRQFGRGWEARPSAVARGCDREPTGRRTSRPASDPRLQGCPAGNGHWATLSY